MKTTLLSFCTFLIGSTLSFSQSTRYITKDAAIKLAYEKNVGLKIADKDLRISKAQYRESASVFLPSINAKHTGITTTNPLMAFGSKLNQEILTPSDFNPSLLNNPNRTTNFATEFTVRQPVIQVAGWQRRKAGQQQLLASKWQQQRSKEHLAFQVAQRYMQLQLAQKTRVVIEKSLASAKANKTLVQDYLAQGMLLKTDLLEISVHVLEVENQLQYAKNTIRNQSEELSLLINGSTDITFQPTDSLVANPVSQFNYTLSEQRADIRAVSSAQKATALLYKAQKLSFLPTLNAFASYAMFDQQLFGGSANGYTLGAQLSWDLFSGYQRIAKLQKSKAMLEKSNLTLSQYTSQKQVELDTAVRQFQLAQQQIITKNTALKQAEESVKITRNRFREGLEKTADLLRAETLYARKQLAYFQAIYQYNTSQDYLAFLTRE